MDLRNKVAVVTGGSSGIGQSICRALVNEGCKVIFTYNSGEAGAKETIKITGGVAQEYKVDLNDNSGVEKFFSSIHKLDILINNAGIDVAPEDQFDMKAWRKTFEADLFWAVKCTGSAVPLMKAGGKILNISSEYADEWMGYPDDIAYSAAKAAINSLTRTLAKKLAPKISVNAISPGYVNTPMWKVTTDAEKKVLGRDQLIGRFIRPEEIAQMAIAILENDAMTGEVVVVDGGLSLKTV